MNPREKISVNHIHLTSLISQLDAIEVAILKERIYTTCKEIIEKKELIEEEMKNSIISPDLYLGTMEKVYNILDKAYKKQFNQS